MPYNTRRKSLSLPSLGIHIPVTHAARAAANRAAANSASASPVTSSKSSSSSSTPKTMAPPSREDRHANKRLKRTHSESEESDQELPSAPLPKKRSSNVKFDHTPPPSPPPTDRSSVEMVDADEDVPSIKKVDLEGINDEIVEAVIVQLENTGNRPHLVKELAAVLMQHLKIVQQSANPAAIISSRLSTYLKRPCWTSLAPCPLAKELETVHPRRTYFYLSTCPHQPLPDPAHAAALSQLAGVQAVARAIISPALSSASDPSASTTSEDADRESRRRELSPSPEVDLSSPEFDDVDDDIAMPSTPIGSLSLRGGYNYFTGGAGGAKASGAATGSGRHHHNRATSPPLEKDEKEFTQTADGLQKRKLRGELLSGDASEPVATSVESDFGNKDDSGLFGVAVMSNSLFMTSPAMRPSFLPLNLNRKDTESDNNWARLDVLEWDRSPENIELDELDCLLSGY
ncbi:hypothetical protein CONLIGDRAFT_583976 [Coniochaeta ligniaria NRRL 30616]|uniref:GDS1 winged helix domain-containing protein n=1 Tax=Coniochaeta ligniaria NRRL 30616 TaxID=1408157 RepID=A0A1J7J3U7_9PEZI|nr:hypothetical protein CONLIGDRAFT_583976 [Coniochaeta ligniaria NRRL 30616]